MSSPEETEDAFLVRSSKDFWHAAIIIICKDADLSSCP